MKHVALFMPTLAGGGAERVMLTLASEFASRGYRVELVLVRRTGAYENHIPQNIKVVDLRARRIIASLPGLIRYLRQNKPPVLISALSATNCIAVWARTVSRSATKVAVVEHSTLGQATQNVKTFGARLLPALMRKTYDKADAIVAVSRGAADDLSLALDVPRTKIRVIYNPVYSQELLNQAKIENTHPWFALGQPPVILAVGRLIPAKDFSSLLRAFASLSARRSARLIILGEGEEREKLEELARGLGIQNSVALPGFVHNPYSYMARSSLFVLSSRWEGLANVLIEAMACGLPVVSTDCPSGPNEILEGGKWGRLVPVSDIGAIASALDDGLAGAIAAHRERAQQFDVPRSVAAYEAIVHELTGH